MVTLMKKLLLSSLIIAGTFAAPTYALDIADITIQDQIVIENNQQQLRGAGIRSKFFMDLYVCSLYNQSPLTADEIMAGKTPASIQMNILSSMITSEKLTASMEEGFENSAGDELPQIQDMVNQFTGAFSEPVSEGDQFRIVSLPDTGVSLYKNGKQLVTINNEQFRRILLGIWLGDDPLSDDLKEEMMGE